MGNRACKKCIIFALFLLLLSGCGKSPSTQPTETIPTDLPSSTPIPGWEQYEIRNITFQLPEGYEDITDQYSEYNPKDDIENYYFGNKKYSSDPIDQTFFGINKSEPPIGFEFTLFMDSLAEHMDSIDGQRVISHAQIDSTPPTEKLVYIMESEYGSTMVLFYIQYIDDSLYRMEYQCEASKFEVRESEYEAIYNTVIISTE